MRRQFKTIHIASMRGNYAAGGFTLVELMIAMVVSGIIMAAVMTLFVIHQRSYLVQDDVSEIQENLRGAMMVMTDEIRLAGCDPLETGGPGIVTALPTQFNFTADLFGNALDVNAADGDVLDAGENITYGFNATDDLDVNGIADNNGAGDWSHPVTGTPLRRDGNNGGGAQPLALFIDALEFNYVLANGTTSTAPSFADLNEIRMVQVSILARADNPSQGFVNTETYTTASGRVLDPPNDAFRRRMMIVNIKLRNRGL